MFDLKDDGTNIIMLYGYKSKHPAIYDYETPALSDMHDPRALVQTILSSPPNL